MGRKLFIFPVIAILAVLLITLTGCGMGKCFMCNQSGFFRQTISMNYGMEALICNSCVKDWNMLVDHYTSSESDNDTTANTPSSDLNIGDNAQSSIDAFLGGNTEQQPTVAVIETPPADDESVTFTTYPDYPGIPDFSSVTGIASYDSLKQDGNAIFAYSGINTGIVSTYNDILINSGFILQEIETFDNGQEYVWKLSNDNYYIAMELFDGGILYIGIYI